MSLYMWIKTVNSYYKSSQYVTTSSAGVPYVGQTGHEVFLFIGENWPGSVLDVLHNGEPTILDQHANFVMYCTDVAMFFTTWEA